MKSALAAAAALLLASGTALALPEYTLVAVTPPGAMGNATGVSLDGTVVGCYTPSGGVSTAFNWKDGKLTDLGPGCADAINNRGVIVGRDSAGNLWMRSGATVTPLGFAGYATGINDAGIVVGWYQDASNASRPYMYANGQRSDLPMQGSATASANAINNRNQVLVNAGGTGYIYENGTMTQIPGIAGSTFSLPNGINDSGVVVGGSSDHGPAPYIYRDGVTTRLANGPGFSYAENINNAGVVLGSGEGIFGYLIDTDGSYHSLSTLASNSAGWGHLEPEWINDNGWIVGNGVGPSANPQPYLLMPRSATTASGPPAMPVMRGRASDFNADGKGDLLWRSGSSYGVWLMDGQAPTAAAGVTAPADAVVVLRADFNGDGATDLLWMDGGGTYFISLAHGTTFATTKVLDGAAGWFAVGAGDFDGDGKSDLLWWNATQGYGVWLMNGAAAAGASAIASPGGRRPSMIADFDGDGRDDIAWAADDGSIELYTMNAYAATDAGQVRAAGTGFTPLAVADFNGDRKADVVWSHADGRQSLWLMNGATSVNSAALVDAGTGWGVSFVGDLNGDGNADLVWKHADGSVGAWLMNGTTALSARGLLGPGTGWSVAALGDVSGDGRADLVWRAADGAYGLWLMDGLTPTWAGQILAAGSGWEAVK